MLFVTNPGIPKIITLNAIPAIAQPKTSFLPDGFSLGGGGSTGPDPSTGEMVSDRTQDYSFASTLDPNAKEITIIVKEIQWIRNHRHFPKQTRPPYMTPVSPADVKITILEGPWEFKIPIRNDG